MNIKKLLVVLSLVAVLVAGSVASVGAQTPMHTSGFKALYSAGQIKASARVLSALNRPIAGAAVQMSFEKDGLPTILRSGKTNAYGWVSLSAPASKGLWVVCVEEIHKLGFAYEPLQNTCASVFVP